jgi:hypothetical protein
MIVPGAGTTGTPLLVSFRFPLERLMPATQPARGAGVGKAERAML